MELAERDAINRIARDARKALGACASQSLYDLSECTTAAIVSALESCGQPRQVAVQWADRFALALQEEQAKLPPGYASAGRATRMMFWRIVIAGLIVGGLGLWQGVSTG